MVYLKENSPENSIVNTWWPPGHFIKAMANRRVTFDGASINKPQAYWIANMYLSQSEDEAIGYARMLNNSGNQAVEYFQNELEMPLSTADFLLKQIVGVDELKARVLLSRVLTNKKHIENIIALTHSRPDPSYIMIYNEFVENNPQLAFIGRWNFKQIEKINANPELMAQVPDANSDEYIDFLWDLNGGQIKYSGILPLISKKDNLLSFQDNVAIDTNSMTCIIGSKKYGSGIPRSMFYLDGNQVIEKKFPNATLSYSVILDQSGPKETVALMNQDLANSLLMRLYFFDGAGFKYIKPFHKTSDLTRRTEIMTFEINWEKYYRDFIERVIEIRKNN